MCIYRSRVDSLMKLALSFYPFLLLPFTRDGARFHLGQCFRGLGGTGDLWLPRPPKALGIWALLAGCSEDPRGARVLSAQALCPGLLPVWAPWLCQVPGSRSSSGP